MDKIKSWISSKVDLSGLNDTLDMARLAFDVMKVELGPDTGVSGDPPLCQACFQIFSRPQKMKQTKILSHNEQRFKASVRLGCYLCSLLNEALWVHRSGMSREILEPKRLGELVPFPAPIVFWIDEPYGEEKPGCFDIHFVGGFIDNPTGDIWQTALLLVPERDIDEMMPQQLSPETSAEAASSLGITWIQDCQDHHEKCNKNKPMTAAWRPSRLIYVGPSSQPLRPRLHISELVALEEQVQYTTLSHCWGTSQIFRLLSTNIDSLMDGIPLKSLTKVFCDAMDLTRRLGIEYIWVDSLCIIQDSYLDWTTESAMMGSVYKHSWCNIAATGFRDGSAGMFIQRVPSLFQPNKFDLELRDGDDPVTRTCQGKFYCMEDFWLSEITNAPLNTRAWVYQERVLAPRVLHLGSRQILWECAEFEACEHFPDGIPKPLESHFKSVNTIGAGLLNGSVHRPAAENIQENNESGEDGEIEDSGNDCQSEDGEDDGSDGSDESNLDTETEAYLSLLERWSKLVYSYNDKILTKYEDKLIAISGIAKEMQPAIGYEYVAGLWAKELLLQLMWFVQPESIQLGRMAIPTSYQAPSWCWASVNAPVNDMYGAEVRKSALEHPVAALIDFSVVRKDENEFGQIIDGFIRIWGPLTQATFIDSDDTLRAKWETQNAPIKLISRSEKKGVVVSPLLLPDNYLIIPSKGDNLPIFPLRDCLGARNFWLLPLSYTTRYQGLVLQHTGMKGQYKRLGAWAQTDDTEEETKRFLNHEPLLEDYEYDELDEDGAPTITIV